MVGVDGGAKWFDQVEAGDAWRADGPDSYTYPACLLDVLLGQPVWFCGLGRWAVVIIWALPLVVVARIASGLFVF